MAIVLTYLFSGFISGESLSRPQNGGNFKMFKIIQFDFNMKRSSQNMSEILFNGNDVIYYATGQPPSQHAILLYKWNKKTKTFLFENKKKIAHCIHV